MITEDLIIGLLICLILLIINVMGFTKVPILSVVGLLGTLITSVSVINYFGEYYSFALLFLLVNTILPIANLSQTIRG